MEWLEQQYCIKLYLNIQFAFWGDVIGIIQIKEGYN